MIKLKMKAYNMILTQEQQKYQNYPEVKVINMNILQAKKYYHLIKTEQQNKLSLHILYLVKHLKNI